MFKITSHYKYYTKSGHTDYRWLLAHKKNVRVYV